uniref:Zasp-like motif domain-containing protein n=1 Tax=Panagrolaimus davidi TaxID=227884 RepID=A0A914PQR5_9BILA
MQHLQYNSPMQLYSSEAAEEQYRQQAASVPNVPTNAPIPLGAGHRQFDPSKSEALKAIRDQDKGDNFGQNFFDKISQAEAPNVPQSVEPNWANEARQKSERARSQTPGAYQHYQNYSDFDNYGIPHSQPPNFTSGPQLEPDPRASEHWQQQRQHRSPSGDRHHNPTGLASEKGYQFGGMDFIDHAHEPYNYDSYQYYDTYPKRKEQKEHTRPGYQYGLDFSSRARSTDGQDRDYYHGYGPQQPKLKPKFSADPHAPINTYTSYNVESVNPVRLIGDTISNQKIRGEKYLTDEEKRTFSTPFAPPPGFKRDHITVHPAPKPPEPICYSLSAKKRPQSTTPSQANQIRVKPRSRTPDASNNDQWYTSGNKEVNIKTLLTDEALRATRRFETPYWAERSDQKHHSWQSGITDPRLNRPQIMRTEPNWTRTVNSRRNAWEQQAQNTEARVQLPASAKVPPPQPPYWADRSHLTQNTWQNTASRLQNHQQWGANQSGQPWAFYNPNDSYANNVARQANQNFVSNVQSNNYGNQNYGSYGTQQNSQRTTSYNNSSSNNVPQAPRQDYSSYNQQSSNYSSQQTTTNKQHQAAIPLPPPP